MRRCADDDRALDAAITNERQCPCRVLGGVPRRRLDDKLDVGTTPGVPHLLGFRRPAARRPAAEYDDVGAAGGHEGPPPRGEPEGGGGGGGRVPPGAGPPRPGG